MADVAPDFPTHVNDSGTGRDGSVVNAAFVEQIITAVNNQVLSPTNPLVTPADTIDEVIAARNAYPSLDARLDDLGTALGITNYATTTQLLGGIGGVNLVVNDDDLLWPDGDAAAPDGYVVAGAGATIARCGTGLGDTNRKIGDFCAKFTRVGTNCTLTHTVLDAASFARADFLKTLYAAGGAWVKCSTANAARVAVYDGAGTVYSAYHTGGGAWEWLPVTRQVNAGATTLAIILDVRNSNTSAYWSGRTLFIIDSNLLLPRNVPCPVTYGGTIHLAVGGVIAATANVGRFEPARSGIIKDVQLHVKTAPTGQELICDVNSWDGAALTSIFATRPQIAAAGFRGGAQPNGAYARRCIRQNSGAALAVSGQVTLDVDQVGSGVAGADLGVEIRVMQYTSPLERFQTY